MVKTQSKSTKGQKKKTTQKTNKLKANIPNEYSGKILSKLFTDEMQSYYRELYLS